MLCRRAVARGIILISIHEAILSTNFNQLANKWDTDYRINRARIISNKIKSVSDLKGNESALEFGCGTGLIGLNLMSSFSSLDFFDTSDEMLKILNLKLANIQVNNISHLYNELDNISDSKYDFIFCSMAFHHIKDLNPVINKIHHLLRENGQLCLVELNSDDGSFHRDEIGFDGHNGFDPAILSNQFERMGFSKTYEETFFRDVREKSNIKFEYSLFILLLTNI